MPTGLLGIVVGIATKFALTSILGGGDDQHMFNLLKAKHGP